MGLTETALEDTEAPGSSPHDVALADVVAVLVAVGGVRARSPLFAAVRTGRSSASWRLFDLEGERRHDLVMIAPWG
jgi:hypothetical protein